MESFSKYYTYVLVRKDIKPEHQIVQACHAALHAGFSFKDPGIVPHLIVCEVADMQGLLEAKIALEQKGINTYLFHEPDWDMGYSALASEPIGCPKTRKSFSKYPLLKLT